MILYINDEHCASLEQLQGYFKEQFGFDSPIFMDLLDYGRAGDIAEWLREQGENKLAEAVDAIDLTVGDAEYIARLSAAINGEADIPTSPSFQKPPFDKCFDIKQVDTENTENGMKVLVRLTVKLSVNESYELRVQTSWGTRAVNINPFSQEEGRTMTEEFVFRKRPNIEFGKFMFFADGNIIINKNNLKNTDVLRIEIGNLSFNMIHVEKGSFEMGYADSSHNLQLEEDFYIGETQVTDALWNAVMGNDTTYNSDLPKDNVSWYGCQNFILKLNNLTGRTFILPTEEQWEYAARGGNKSKGYRYSGSNDIDKVAWSNSNSAGWPHPVKQKKPNELGLYDMTGNVLEWCQNEKYGRYPCRGGSYRNGKEKCEIPYTVNYDPSYSSYFIGLRLCLQNDEKKTCN